MQRPWIFRVASTPQVGGGHVSRCLTIAAALPTDLPCLFVLDEGGENWTDRIEADGFQAAVNGQQGDGPWPGCLLDGYGFRDAEINYWRNKANCLAMMDDTDAEMTCDIVIQVAGNEAVSLSPETVLLSGLRYAPIDPRFAALRRPSTPSEASKFLLSFGLRDSVNANTVALQALFLAYESRAMPSVKVAIGSDAPHLEALKEYAAKSSGAVELLLDQKLLDLMVDCDFMIGAGGMSLIERMAAGIPSITIAVADNQTTLVDHAASAGATYACQAESSDLAKKIVLLSKDGSARDAMSKAATDLVDGQGAERIALAFASHPSHSLMSCGA